MYIYSTLLMVGLVVAASIHVALYVQFFNVYLSANWVGSFKHLLYVTKKYLYANNNRTLRFRFIKTIKYIKS